MKIALLAILRIYRKFMSPLKLQSCRFYPSCSEYAIEAIERYGALRGVFYAARRLLRCHPLSPGGYDPLT